ncbi:helix-turn-helix domain-containing protein [Microbacterium sp.]|uniref:winged helix-turn-helix transcriptional regulator n=1 Tax=Microbacterium sp. TaxID=51671 RepID=UPI002811757A|nr:helix-turn-helix domain-containing protein [Microbacterium sp.]
MNDDLGFDPYDPNCPSRQLVDRVGDRWTILVIGALSAGPARYKELATRVAGISPRMLSLTLKALERDGLITREAFPEVPPRVVYTLTDSGRTLRPLLLELEHWARANMREVQRARERYDRQTDQEA